MSAFGRILAGLLDEIEGAEGAVFVDWEGETVDQAGSADALALQLHGAHWDLVFRLTGERLAPSELNELTVWTERGLIVVRPVAGGYRVVLLTDGNCELEQLDGPLIRCVEALRREM
jgi:predicted regulator of Ras-like GTPase activity (Roadblock/LC7/MglB family)